MINPPGSPPHSSEGIRSPLPPASSFPWITPLHWVGYGLLLLALLNLVDTLFPLGLMNPVWEFQTIGALVELAPLILVGFVVAFLIDRDQSHGWESLVLKMLSWLALGMGVVYLLLVPLGIVNMVRIDRLINQQLAAQVEEKQNFIQQVKEELSQVQTTSEMEALISSISNTGTAPTIQDNQQLEQVREQLSSEITVGEEQFNAQVASTRSSQRTELWKKSVKWNLGAAIVGCLFVSIWRSTGWVREK